MAKAYRHAASSAKRFGGAVDDYIAIHEKMDSTKMAHAAVTHRALFHSSYGIYLIEDLFGRVLQNRDRVVVCVRDVAEQHVLEDLGFIPSLDDWFGRMALEPWMMGLRTKKVVVVD